MGDIADMMLDGTLCEGCGVYLGSEGDFPQLCGGCAKDRRAVGEEIIETGFGTWQDITPIEPAKKAKMLCPICGRKISPSGMLQHAQAKHPGNLETLITKHNDRRTV